MNGKYIFFQKIHKFRIQSRYHGNVAEIVERWKELFPLGSDLLIVCRKTQNFMRNAKQNTPKSATPCEGEMMLLITQTLIWTNSSRRRQANELNTWECCGCEEGKRQKQHGIKWINNTVISVRNLRRVKLTQLARSAVRCRQRMNAAPHSCCSKAAVLFYIVKFNFVNVDDVDSGSRTGNTRNIIQRTFTINNASNDEPREGNYREIQLVSEVV